MFRRNLLAAGAVALTVALAVGSGVYFRFQAPSFAESSAMVLPVDPAPLVVKTRSGERFFKVEIADDPNERSAGLMFREQMPDDHGMLFVFEQPQDVAFWMKNTPMPLDLIFIGQEGRVRAIKEGEPQSEAVISPGQPVRFVLELKAGTAARAGIADGDLVVHPLVSGIGGTAEPPPDNGDAPNAGDAD